MTIPIGSAELFCGMVFFIAVPVSEIRRSASGRELLQLLWESCDNYGQTIMVVTHDPGVAIFADRDNWRCPLLVQRQQTWINRLHISRVKSYHLAL